MTHARLMETAIREFASKGLDGASTRGIAKAAGTAMSAITYHYGGKLSLYHAAADHIALRMAEEMAPAIVDRALIDSADPADARMAIHAIVERLIDKMASDASADWALFIMREQVDPTAAFDRIYAGMMGEMIRTLVRLVETVTARDAQTARFATMTLLGQALAVRASRATMLRLLDVPQLDAATVATLKTRIHANIDAILDRMIAEEPQ
jgi:AcrR family transcriptional regulator